MITVLITLLIISIGINILNAVVCAAKYGQVLKYDATRIVAVTLDTIMSIILSILLILALTGTFGNL